MTTTSTRPGYKCTRCSKPKKHTCPLYQAAPDSEKKKNPILKGKRRVCSFCYETWRHVCTDEADSEYKDDKGDGQHDNDSNSSNSDTDDESPVAASAATTTTNGTATAASRARPPPVRAVPASSPSSSPSSSHLSGSLPASLATPSTPASATAAAAASSIETTPPPKVHFALDHAPPTPPAQPRTAPKSCLRSLPYKGYGDLDNDDDDEATDDEITYDEITDEVTEGRQAFHPLTDNGELDALNAGEVGGDGGNAVEKKNDKKNGDDDKAEAKSVASQSDVKRSDAARKRPRSSPTSVADEKDKESVEEVEVATGNAPTAASVKRLKAATVVDKPPAQNGVNDDGGGDDVSAQEDKAIKEWEERLDVQQLALNASRAKLAKQRELYRAVHASRLAIELAANTYNDNMRAYREYASVNRPDA